MTMGECRAGGGGLGFSGDFYRRFDKVVKRCSYELMMIALPPRCMELHECRVGDWEDARFVREWSLRDGLQRYQPLALGERGRSPFDESRFDFSRPVWEFRRCLSPRASDAGAHSIWRRVG